MMDEGRYQCESCREEIVVPIDPSGGAVQEYVEDPDDVPSVVEG